MAGAVIVIRVAFRAAVTIARGVLVVTEPARMAGPVVIMGIVPRAASARVTVIHAAIPAGMAGPIIIIRGVTRAAFAGVLIVHAAEIALVAFAIVNIRVALRAALVVAR
jgi:hypothetical protein